MLRDSCWDSPKWWLFSPPPGARWQQLILVAWTFIRRKPLPNVPGKALDWCPLAAPEPIPLAREWNVLIGQNWVLYAHSEPISGTLGMEHADWPDPGHRPERERNAVPGKVREGSAGRRGEWAGAGLAEEQGLLMWKGRAWGD